MWLNTGLVGLGLGLVSLFGEETVYRPTEAQGRKSGLVGQTMQLTGVNGYRSYTGGVESVVRDIAVMLTRPHFVGLCGMRHSLAALCLRPTHSLSLLHAHFHVVHRPQRNSHLVCGPSSTSWLWIQRPEGSSAVHFTNGTCL